MFRAVCCGLALTATLFAAVPAEAAVAITFPTPAAAVALPSPTDLISIFGAYTAPTGAAPFAAAPFTLSFTLPSEVQVTPGTGVNGSFSLGGISGAYANNGEITGFSGATVQLLASTNFDYGEINLNAPQFLVPTGLFSLSVLTSPRMFNYDPVAGTITLALGTFALDSGQASYGLDPSIGSNASGVNLSQPVAEPSTWALLLVGCLGLAVLARRRAVGATG